MPSSDWIAALGAASGCRLRAPAAPSSLGDAESELGVTFPGELRALYLISDGVFDTAGQWFVIWPVAELVRRNQAAWAVGNSIRRGLLAFGDDGTGRPSASRPAEVRMSSSGTPSWTRKRISHPA